MWFNVRMSNMRSTVWKLKRRYYKILRMEKAHLSGSHQDFVDELKLGQDSVDGERAWSARRKAWVPVLLEARRDVGDWAGRELRAVSYRGFMHGELEQNSDGNGRLEIQSGCRKDEELNLPDKWMPREIYVEMPRRRLRTYM